MEIAQALKSFGLNDREINVYVSLLELGSSKVNRIAEKSSIIRETTYGILKSLIEKGLANYVIKGGVKYFSATDPSQLISMLKEKQEIIQEVLPTLRSLTKTPYTRTQVELYEGNDGLKTVYKEIINGPQKEIRGFLNTKLAKELLPFFLPSISRERAKKRIKSLMLMDDSEESRERVKNDKKELRETRVLPVLNNFKTGIYLFGNKTAFVMLKKDEPKGIIINDESIAQSLEEIHKYLWAKSQK